MHLVKVSLEVLTSSYFITTKFTMIFLVFKLEMSSVSNEVVELFGW